MRKIEPTQPITTEVSDSCIKDLDKELHLPKNIFPSLIRKCCDSRATECPYAFLINFKDDYISINKILCLFSYKRKD